MKHSLIHSLCLTLVTACFSLGAHSQLVGQLQEKVDSLRSLGVDTILYYHPFFSPTTEEADDSCIIHERAYLIWKQGEQIKILKEFLCTNIRSNSNYRIARTTLQNDTSSIFKYLSTNFNSIVNDKMLKAVLRKRKNKKIEIQDFNNVAVYDDGYTGISILLNDKTYYNGYSSNDLNDGIVRNVDGSIREIWSSLNYNINRHKSIYKIISKIESHISTLEKLKII